uniref:Serpentine receptor class gamma n=1 Tax=Rhabditophanes sp. KR3021 TaxID=114890 RepID=A0AC35TJK1_9BILA
MNDSNLLIHQIQAILPFVTVEMSTLSVVVHFIVGILFYIAYAILITQILRYRKTIEELKTPFYSAVVPCYVIGLYPGFASIAAQFSDNFTWHWTPVYALQYYFTSCQFALGFYLSFIRLVMVLFTVSGPTWIQKTFRYFIATIFIISAFPTFYLFGSRTRFFKLDLRMTNQVQTYFLAYEPWIKGTSNALNCIIFFSIFIILSIATSVGTIIKLIRLKKETKVFKISEKTKATVFLKAKLGSNVSFNFGPDVKELYKLHKGTFEKEYILSPKAKMSKDKNKMNSSGVLSSSGLLTIDNLKESDFGTYIADNEKVVDGIGLASTALTIVKEK